jgi:ankyrin repeat protein
MSQSKRYRLYVHVITYCLTVISVVVLSGCSSMPLQNAMFKGDIDKARQLIVEKQDIDKPNSLGFRPLHIAADKGQSEIFKALVAQGVTIDPKANTGWTPLMFAVMRGYRTMVEVLVEKGADVNARNNDGGTPIMIASYNGRESIFDYLLDKGASLDIKANNGLTALMMASENGHLSIANKLIKLGVDVNVGNDAGWTPLMFAAKSGSDDLVQILIDKGADINARNKGGASPVLIAVSHDHMALAAKMIHLGAQPVGIDSYVDDTFASAKLYKLMAEIREKEGNNVKAKERYQTAATFFEKASVGYKEKAGEMKKSFWKATFANALVAGIAAGGATYQAQQTGGVGMQSYQQVGTGRFVELEKIFTAKAEQCHALAVECSSLSQKLRQ